MKNHTIENTLGIKNASSLHDYLDTKTRQYLAYVTNSPLNVAELLATLNNSSANHVIAQLMSIHSLKAGAATYGTVSFEMMRSATAALGELTICQAHRLQFKNFAWLDQLDDLVFLKECTRHKGTYTLVVAGNSKIDITTNGDLTTFDFTNLARIPVGHTSEMFLKQCVLEKLRTNILKSRNAFQKYYPTSRRLGFSLHKSSLTVGNLDHLAEKIHSNLHLLFTEDDLKNYGLVAPVEGLKPFIVTENVIDKRFRKYRISSEYTPSFNITVIDKTFYFEI